MLKKEDIKKLSELTKIPVETLTTAIEAEEETPLDFSEADKVNWTFTDEELEERDLENAKKAGNTAIEMAVKEARNENDFKFEGKTVPNLVKAALAKGKEEGLKEANAKPNETIELQKTKIEELQENIEKIESDNKEEIDRLKSENSRMKTNKDIAATIPDNLDTPLTNSDLLTLYNSEHELKTDENGESTWYKNGKPCLDEKSKKSKPTNVVMAEFIKDKGIKVKANPRGRGGEDDKGAGGGDGEISNIKTTDDFYAYEKANKITPDKRPQLLKDVIKANPEFILGES